MGPGIRQCIGPIFDLWSTYLGDQWSIGAWDAMREGAPTRLPEWLQGMPVTDDPPQFLKEYDPEWGRSFWTGTVAASCDHERMLRSVKVPVLLTHHMRVTNDATGFLFGAMSDQQAQRAQDLLRAAGVPLEYRSFPDGGHLGRTTRWAVRTARTLTEVVLLEQPGVGRCRAQRRTRTQGSVGRPRYTSQRRP